MIGARCRQSGRVLGLAGTLVALVATGWATSGCVVSASAVKPLPFQEERTIERDFDIAPGGTLEIRNLAGRVAIGAADGDAASLRATVRAGGSEQAQAVELAESIGFLVQEEGDRVIVTLTYPVDEYTEFHYQQSDSSSGLWSLLDHSNTKIRYLDRRVTVSARRRGRSASVHADLEIALPSRAALALTNAVGKIEADGVVADMRLEVDSGAIRTAETEGQLSLDTGSGSIDVSSHQGALSADTGSGSVTLDAVRGEVLVDTGSGSVEATDVEGPFVSIDTGSGSVRLKRVSGSIEIDTGSGSIRATEIVSGERLVCDTGSGSVKIHGDLSAAREIVIDTSSGSVEVRASALPALSLDLETGSGGIDVDLADVQVVRQDRGLFIGRVGDGESGTMAIDTGSGGIKVSDDG